MASLILIWLESLNREYHKDQYPHAKFSQKVKPKLYQMNQISFFLDQGFELNDSDENATNPSRKEEASQRMNNREEL